MADLEITSEEINGTDVNNIASMQLKDGTTIVVSGGEQIQAEGELNNLQKNKKSSKKNMPKK